MFDISTAFTQFFSILTPILLIYVVYRILKLLARKNVD